MPQKLLVCLFAALAIAIAQPAPPRTHNRPQHALPSKPEEELKSFGVMFILVEATQVASTTAAGLKQCNSSAAAAAIVMQCIQ